MVGRPFFLVALSVAAVGASAQVYPGKQWQTDDRALSPIVKKRVRDYVESLDTTGLVIVKGGKIGYQYGDTRVLSYLASSRKSVLSMAYGKYVENGTIDLSKTLADLNMDDNPVTTPAPKGSSSGPTTVPGLLPIEKTAKVRDLIMARSGVYHPASNPGDLLEFAPARGSKTPGSYWLYSNWDFNAAGFAFEKMTGKKIFDAVQDDLAKPIEMQDYDRHRQQMLGDPKASRYMAYHMWFSTRDMARLGLLMLHGGVWNGKQLVPAKWVTESTKAWTPYDELNPADQRGGPWGYGYLWWVWDGPFDTGAFKGAYTSRGAYGQYITVMPGLGLVVAHKTVPVNQFFADTDYVQLLHRVAGDTPASEIVLPVLEKKGRGAALTLYKSIEKKPGVVTDESDLFTAGATADREKKYRLAEEAFDLNLALYPSSARSMLGLGRAYRHEGKRRAAVEMLHKVPQRGFNSPRAKLELAEMGEPVDGHNMLLSYARGEMDAVAGRYKSKELRYIVAREGNRLHIREIDPMGDLNDDYLAFADSKGGYYVPFDGTHVDFVKKEIVRTIGSDKQRGERVR
jgi:CubicO group peptidase (beta-lactamase class C family)